MTVTQVAGGLGSWTLTLNGDVRDDVLTKLGMFGHIVIVDGPVDVEATGQGLLAGARYVGVLREKDTDTGRTLSGSGMAYWLGDEDGKGAVIETEMNLSGMTFTQAVSAVLAADPHVTTGTIHAQAGTLPTGSTYVYRSPRQVLGLVCDAFGTEFRVNGNGSVDAGTAAQLYNTEDPSTILVRQGAKSDMDLTSLSGNFGVKEGGWDYTNRAVLLGQTTPAEGDPELFVTGTADAASVPYFDLFGNPVKSTRLISESGTPAGAAAPRAQLQLNRWNRLVRTLRLSLTEFSSEGSFVPGDNVLVFDPETGLIDPARETFFAGQVWHPMMIRSVSLTWPVTEGQTVAFRTGSGEWIDLTRWVSWETGGGELIIGDLPRSLSRGSEDPVQLRVEMAKATSEDASIPAAPTGLTLTTSSVLNARGATVSLINAAWTAPTLNADGTVLTDLSHYLVRYRWTGRAPQWSETIAIGTNVDLTVAPSLPHEVQIAAVDVSGHVSAWTAIASITSSADAIAPPAPADAAVTSYYGQLRIEVSGLDNLGNPLPSDTSQINVHVGAVSGFTPDATTRVISLPPGRNVAFATAPYGALRYVKLVAEDHDGNLSAPSGQVTGSTVRVGDGDIAELNVGKLVSGTGTFDLILAGTILTAATGQRSGMTAAGFFAWNSAEEMTVRLDGVANLLTGTLQTALSGRRIVAGASGNSGMIQFLSPDGKQGRVWAFTSTVGQPGTEAIRVGIVPDSTTIWPGWSSLQVEGTGVDQAHVNGMGAFVNFIVGGDGTETAKGFQVEWASDRGTATTNPTREVRIAVTSLSNIHYIPISGFFNVIQRLSGGGTRDRIAVTGTQIQLRDNTGMVRMMLNDEDFSRVIGPTAKGVALQDSDGTAVADRLWFNSGGFYFRFRGTNRRVVVEDFATGRASPLLKLINMDNFGATLYYGEASAGTDVRLEIGDAGQTTYIPVWASAFVVSSSETVKGPFGSLGFDALAEVRSMPIGTFQRRKGKDADGAGPGGLDDRVEVGTIAERAPAPIQIIGKGHTPMVDHVGWTALNTAAIQQLAAMVEELQRGRP